MSGDLIGDGDAAAGESEHDGVVGDIKVEEFTSESLTGFLTINEETHNDLFVDTRWVAGPQAVTNDGWNVSTCG